MSGKKIKLHISARKKLIEYASKKRFPDGWLPPERTLCQELGISRGTLRKALSQLISEGYIVSIPPKGNYITGARSRINVGVITGEGDLKSANISLPNLLGSVMNMCGDAGCGVKLLDLKSKSHLDELIQGFSAIDGLLWCMPSSSVSPVIKKIITESKIPLVIATVRDVEWLNDLSFKNYVAQDFKCVGQNKAAYFAECGHQQIVYVGDPEDCATYRSFKKTLSQNGINYNDEWHIESIEKIQKRLPEIFDRFNITGIMSNGGPDIIESLFISLKKFKQRQDLDILVDYVSELPSIMYRHPEVKINAVSKRPLESIGKNAATHLLKIIKGEKVKMPILMKNDIEIVC
ncbi:MAG: GntR family transcriptional regulator [Planctomycetota bacterium]|jgi:DNA-binding LacI/PurR family transcriptional regulator